MIFVNSMSDIFHDDVPDDYIIQVARVMAAANWHTYQVLTKRADRMKSLLKGKLRFAAGQAHIWWGVSVENRKHGELICCVNRPRECASFPSNHCSNISARST
jgi:protein gp37